MWNSWGEGWEVGEYVLMDIQGEFVDWVIVVGNFFKKLQEYCFEFWDSVDEFIVGILYSWENEVMFGCFFLGVYDMNMLVYKIDWDKQFWQFYFEVCFGFFCVLMNNNIFFEYFMECDLDVGLVV